MRSDTGIDGLLMDYHWSCWWLGLGHFGIENHRWIITEAADVWNLTFWNTIDGLLMDYHWSCWCLELDILEYNWWIIDGLSLKLLICGTWYFGIQLMDYWWITTEADDDLDFATTFLWVWNFIFNTWTCDRYQADTWRNNNVIITSKWRRDVVLT